MTIRGKRFRKATGRTTSPKRSNSGAKMLKAWNTPQARTQPNTAAQLRAFQSQLKPIRNRKMGSRSGNASTHTMLVTDQGGGVYGYIRT